MDHPELIEGLSSASGSDYWAAAVAAGELVESDPEQVWQLVKQFGVSHSEDVRAAVATCMLEHLLERHFSEYFPLLESELLSGNRLLGETFRVCWKFGEAQKPNNSARWDMLVEKLGDSGNQ